ncbi:MAG: DUF1499 domain-containing protein [Thermoanaerobaculia bacterium]|nr:DUF1499 domain-containing protein [Thermoanaerobaculia bacterium]
MPATQSLSARLALWIAIASIGLILLGTLGARLGLLAPIQGFLLFAVGLLPGTLLTLVVGLVGLFRTRTSTGLGGRPSALRATLVGCALLLVALVLFGSSAGVPAIHDITTDPDDPPRFIAAATHPDNAGRDLTYPHGSGDVTAMQRDAYPDLAPIRLPAPPAAAFAAAVETARELGWEVTAEDAPNGRIEATDTSAIFTFVDDIVIRIRAAGAGSVIDLRSTSRVGESDLGANAERIRAFRDAILDG